MNDKHRIPAFLVCLGNLAATLVFLFPMTIFGQDKPNIVLIMVDDMGYGDAGCFNSESKIPTPNIDRLATDGMRFTDAHAPGPLCHLSRYGLMTGRYPFRTNVGVWRTKAVIAPDRMTIASLLNSNGYTTSMVGKWHLGFDENGYDKPLPGGPIDRGFGSYFGIRASTDIPPYFYIRGNHAVAAPTHHIEARQTAGWSPIQGEFWRAGGIAPNLRLHDVLPRFTAEAIQVIEAHAAAHQRGSSTNPLFLYLAYPAPHTPWLPSPEFHGKSGASMYGDFMVMVDQMIGRVIDSLSENELTNTMIILTSDNGPVWYEKDVQRFGHDSSGGLRGMKADAWEAGHRMPLIVKWTEKIAANSICDQTICFTDLLATFAALLHQKLPVEAGPDSFNLMPLLLGESNKPVRKSLVIASGNGMMTCRMGRWKLIQGLGSGGFSKPARRRPGPNDPPGQLYDLSSDLGETKNVYVQHPKVVRRLEKELQRVTMAGRSR